MAKETIPAENARIIKIAAEGDRYGGLVMFKELAEKMSRKKQEQIHSLISQIVGDNPSLLECLESRKYADICKNVMQEVNINSASESGKTLLCVAAQYGDLEAIKLLVNGHADLNVRDAKGFTPLQDAVIGAQPRAMEVLLSEGAEVEAQNFTGSPLLLATLRGDIPCIKILLDGKANPNCLFGDVVTPLVITVMNDERCLFHSQNNTKEIVELLIKAGAKVGKSRLLGCCHSTELMEYLLKCGANPNLHDEYGRLPIEMAAMRGEREVVEILFPLTNPIPNVPDWSIEGFLNHVASEEFKKQWEKNSEMRVRFLKERILGELSKEEYLTALILCTYALEEDRGDASFYAERSRCWMHLGNAQCARLSFLYQLNSTRDADLSKSPEAIHALGNYYLSKHDLIGRFQIYDPAVNAVAAIMSAQQEESLSKKTRKKRIN